jgi:hypothetical protein
MAYRNLTQAEADALIACMLHLLSGEIRVKDAERFVEKVKYE